MPLFRYGERSLFQRSLRCRWASLMDTFLSTHFISRLGRSHEYSVIGYRLDFDDNRHRCVFEVRTSRRIIPPSFGQRAIHSLFVFIIVHFVKPRLSATHRVTQRCDSFCIFFCTPPFAFAFRRVFFIPEYRVPESLDYLLIS